MEFTAKSYQELAIQHVLDHEASGLFLDVGLGKTVITLTALVQIMFDDFECRKALVIAPKRVAEHQWDTEVAKWDHTDFLTVSKVLGTEQQRSRALLRRADIYVINRENVDWLVNFYGKHWPFDFLIIDELSSFKSPKSRRFRALRRVRPFFKRVVGLTGTPAPNGLLDLWPQIYLLDMGERLGVRYTEYRQRYFEADREGWVDGRPKVYSYKPVKGAAKVIHSKIGDMCISMSAKDWLDLEEPIEITREVRLSASEIARYSQFERDLLLPVDGGEIVAGTAAALSNKLLQFANGAVYYGEKGQARQVEEVHGRKLDELEDILEAANGQPILVWYAFQHDLARIQKRFPQAHVFSGAQDVDRWNEGEIELLVAHPASVGHGLNLQYGGHIMVWFGVPWSLELYQQGRGRLQRTNQDQQVIIHHIITIDTHDEDVMVSIKDKTAGQDALMQAVRARIERVQSEREG